jgi:hypothetical protein
MTTEQQNTISEQVVPRSERRAQEIMDLKNWSKTANGGRNGYLMNLEALLSEVGIHLLYDWGGEYTPEKRAQIIQQHMDKYPHWRAEEGDMQRRSFISDVINKVSSLQHWCAEDGTSQEFSSTTFEQFEQALPKNGLESKLLAISNCNQCWVFSSKNGSEETMPYTLQDRIEYRIIGTILDDIDEYRWGDESEDEEGTSEAEDYGFVFDRDGAYPILDEEHIRRMGPQNVIVEEEMYGKRKEMCSKGLGILESIMETDDQRMGEGDFVELCNLLKELHRT